MSINVDMKHPPTKKRVALENISNGIINAQATHQTNSQVQANNLISGAINGKKSRVSASTTSTTSTTTTTTGTTTSTNATTTSHLHLPLASKVAAAKATSHVGQVVKPSHVGSKENLNKKPTAKKTTVTAEKTSKQQCTTTTATANKDVAVKIEPMIASTPSSSSADMNIETKLASTSLTSSSSSSLSTTLVANLSADQVQGWEDIDQDETDEFSAHDYVSAIFKYYKEREAKFHVDDYIKRQTNINKQMRLLLVDWMVEVQQQLEFNHEVLYLSVKLLDLYLNARLIEKEKLQLLGGAAMFIACKFEERMPPIIDDFIYVSDNAYDRNDLIKMEIEILKTIRFDIGAPLSYTFLRRYSKCVRADMKFLTLARYILELSLQDYGFAYLKDSLKACAALFLAMRMAVAYENTNNTSSGSEQPQLITTQGLTSTHWNATLIHYTGSFVSDFVDYVPMMNQLIKAAPGSKYKTIHEKYSHQVFYQVAKIAPLSDHEISKLIENASKSPQC